jgi:hypothetical protein
MNPTRRAYMAVVIARAVWRAREDLEAQVAQWCLEKTADVCDLESAREETRIAKSRLKSAQLAYRLAASGKVVG